MTIDLEGCKSQLHKHISLGFTDAVRGPLAVDRKLLKKRTAKKNMAKKAASPRANKKV